MTVLADTWRQLVRRRLWPVAVALVAALVAVPVVLGTEPAPVVAPPLPAPEPVSAATEAATGDPVVAMAAAEDRAARRTVLGARKDPFEPARSVLRAARAELLATRAAEREARASAAAQESGGSGSSGGGSLTETGGGAAPGSPTSSGASGGSGSTGSGSFTPPATPAPDPAPAPGTEDDDADEPSGPRYELNSLVIRFGDAAGGSLERMDLERLEALPSADDPVLVYLGLGKDRESAVFLVDAAVELTGDGSCEPHPTTCETVELREGETEFFDVLDDAGNVTASYQLDLVDIRSKETKSEPEARRAYATESPVGRAALKAHVAEVGPLRWDYDPGTGTLRRRSRHEVDAVAARLAGLAGVAATGPE